MKFVRSLPFICTQAILLILLTNCPRLQASEAGLPPGVVVTQNPKDKPISPTEALNKMSLPDGFRATLFAGEPDVMQPIAFDFDDRGRLWVVECFSYPDWKTTNRDRVLILTDKDGDGRFDEWKVFFDQGHRLSGITVGFGGVWLTSPPELLFIPDANGDDVPDGPPIVHLDGFTLQAGHNLVNGLAWGPDGWLYGRHGITTSSLVGRPGTPDKQRIKLNCSIWRYHPTRHIFEVVANGTTNPWGLDWDENGQAFFSNNVIGHLWHLIPGAHYQRMFGEDFNPYLYGLMESCSDHKHFAGSDWTKSRGGVGEHNQLGGGHSHAGAMIYQGDNWPDEFRHRIMMANIHGNRLLYDELSRSGSGYVGKHGASFLMANDPWFRAISIHYGPDGGVFVSDWNDLGECHDNDGSYRASGRIYKVVHGKTEPLAPFNLAALDDAQLVQRQLHKNEWFVRHARRILQERAAAGKLSPGVERDLRQILTSDASVPHQLRAIWALHAIGALHEPDLLKLADDRSEFIRWWAVQLLIEDRRPSPAVLDKFAAMAEADTSSFVRLSLASALQRIELKSRWPIAEKLVKHEEDSSDKNLPLMIWYAIEPLVPADPGRAIKLAGSSKIKVVREYISRRIAAR
jgi:putative membrane-bound dehydrogenase-like protein